MYLFAPSLGRWQGGLGMERCTGHSNTVVLQSWSEFSSSHQSHVSGSPRDEKDKALGSASIRACVPWPKWHTGWQAASSDPPLLTSTSWWWFRKGCLWFIKTFEFTQFGSLTWAIWKQPLLWRAWWKSWILSWLWRALATSDEPARCHFTLSCWRPGNGRRQGGTSVVSRTGLLSSCILASQRQPLSLMWHSAPEIFTSGTIYGCKSPFKGLHWFLAWVASVIFFMNVKSVHERKGVLYTWMYRSVLADHIYLQMDIWHLSAVATALPWIFKQYCWKCFMFEGSFIWIYQKQMPAVMYMSEGLGWNGAHLHQVQFEGNKKVPFWNFLADLNSICSFEETFWKG